MTLGTTYSTGTVSVANGSTLVESAGALWSDVLEGDWIQIGTAVGMIQSVNANFDEITLKDPWPGQTVEDADYRVIKMSWHRFDPALTQAKLREFIQKIENAGLFLFVAGAEPDDALGENGQYALKTNDPSVPWRLWYKTDDQWVEQGTPLGINFRSDANNGIWDNETEYFQRDIVRDDGKLWYAKRNNTGKKPVNNPDDWAFFYPFPTQASVSIVLDSMESEIATGPVDGPQIGFNAVLRKVTMRGDGNGDFKIDIRKRPFEDGVPGAEHSIIGEGTKPELDDARDYSDNVLTGWTTTFSENDATQIYVENCAGLTRVVITFYFDRVWSV